MYGLFLALAAAALFGASVPASKLLLQPFDPLQLAGLLYLGAAAAMAPPLILQRRRVGPVRLDRANRARLFGVVTLGGIFGPILLLVALRFAPAGPVSLLLNFEGVATAVLGALAFHEPLRRSAWLGVAGVVLASALLSGEAGLTGVVATLLVVGACMCWAIDNHLSALIDGMTPARSTLWKGTIAGATNLALGIAFTPLRATALSVAAAVAVGAASYGASIALHTAAAQRVGAVRAQAVFATAPFIGAALSWLLLGEPFSPAQGFAAGLFLFSVALLVGRPHAHRHHHDATSHVHAHVHDDGHHLHEHPEPVTVEHTHWHQHEPVEHVHPHWPDLHHRHSHPRR